MEKKVFEAHRALCHPGVERLWEYVKERKWAVSLEDVKEIVSNCDVCSEVKPRFVKTECATLIKASHPWERISIDFKVCLLYTSDAADE